MQLKSIGIFTLILAVIVLAWAAFVAKQRVYRSPASPHAYPTEAESVSTSTPPVKNVGDTLEVETPIPNTSIRSPLRIAGRAKGSWYFEGQFLVQLIDTKGNVLAEAPARASSEWPEENFVPFSLTLEFATPTTTPTGLLILKKDNPSGDPSQDIMFAIPVKFK